MDAIIGIFIKIVIPVLLFVAAGLLLGEITRIVVEEALDYEDKTDK